MEAIAVMGGGVAGLAATLALKDAGRDILVIERDPKPPDIRPQEAFERWVRPGVPQFHHAHMFLARLRTLLRDRYPELLRELYQAGLELSELKEVLPPSHIERFEPRPGDDDLLHLWGRRPTFEYVLRRHVGRIPNVHFVHDAVIEGLATVQERDEVRVCGVRLSQGGRSKLIPAAFVIDALGKRTRSPQWLRDLGVSVQNEAFPSDRAYVCRHYRLRHPNAGPPRVGTGANLDYFGYATFYAEHGHYAITLSCPIEEERLARSMRRPEGFEEIVRRIPVLAEWLRRSEATTKVLGAGRFENRWTRYGAKGGRRLSGLFPVGDAHVETNPMYGRGCASAFLQAQALQQAVEASDDPADRARRYYTRTHELLRPHFDFCKSTDDMFRSRGKQSRGEAVTRLERILRYAYEELWLPAMEQSPLCAREMVKAMQMGELSPMRTRLRVLWHIARAWLGQRFGRGEHHSTEQAPARSEVLHSLSDT